MKKFNWQIFISLNLLFTFLIMLLSGLILYIKPEGSVARWLNWKILLLDKATWESVHTLFSFLFTLFALLHILIIHLPNLSNYLNSKVQHSRKEVILALIITVFFLGGSAIHVQPFSWVYKGGNYLSDSWKEFNKPEQEQIDARTTLQSYSEAVHVPVDSILKNLEQTKLSNITKEATLLEIAEANNMAPYEIYQLLSDLDLTAEVEYTKEHGTITLGEIAFLYNANDKKLVDNLREKWSFPRLTEDTTLEEIAFIRNTSTMLVKNAVLKEIEGIETNN